MNHCFGNATDDKATAVPDRGRLPLKRRSCKKPLNSKYLEWWLTNSSVRIWRMSDRRCARNASSNSCAFQKSTLGHDPAWLTFNGLMVAIVIAEGDAPTCPKRCQHYLREVRSTPKFRGTRSNYSTSRPRPYAVQHRQSLLKVTLPRMVIIGGREILLFSWRTFDIFLNPPGRDEGQVTAIDLTVFMSTRLSDNHPNQNITIVERANSLRRRSFSCYARGFVNCWAEMAEQ